MIKSPISRSVLEIPHSTNFFEIDSSTMLPYVDKSFGLTPYFTLQQQITLEILPFFYSTSNARPPSLSLNLLQWILSSES